MASSKPRDAVCPCVTDHNPGYLEIEWHHVWPLGMGGPDVIENQVPICPTTHSNAHTILRMMVKAKRPLAWRDVLPVFTQPVSRYAYRLALLGYRRSVSGALEPAQGLF